MSMRKRGSLQVGAALPRGADGDLGPAPAPDEASREAPRSEPAAQGATRRQLIGRRGEDLAQAFLLEKGFRVLHRNRRVGALEIDLIVAHEGLVAIVEVRTRRDTGLVGALASVSRAKQLHLIAAAERLWPQLQRDAGDPQAWLRFDVVAVTVGPGTPRVEHFPGAFERPQSER